jgi:hypothetical protein
MKTFRLLKFSLVYFIYTKTQVLFSSLLFLISAISCRHTLYKVQCILVSLCLAFKLQHVTRIVEKNLFFVVDVNLSAKKKQKSLLSAFSLCDR